MANVITALQVQKKNPQRVNIFINDEFAFGLARIVAAWLKVGQELSDAKIAELKNQDQKEQALQRALNLLSYRPRSETEVRNNLKKHEIPEETTTAVITRLRETGLLNDERFAEAWVENRATFRPRSKLALRIELAQKGIDKTIIDDTLENVSDEEQAYEAGQKKARQIRTTDEKTFKHKLLGFLARRGFSYEVASPVVKKLWEEKNNEEDTTWKPS
ncbi:MAG: RecX family transcriptional regulator [Anaerolineales bacterium]|jgi:regulatory protein|nr:RecX family transcriptional regulator [Anaerolineales bacterium]